MNAPPFAVMAIPRRIVSLVPSLTETLFALGVGDRLVGATRYCAEPAAALELVPRVGGTKNPDRAKIAALAPDLVLVNDEENRAEDIAWLRQHFDVFASMPRSILDVADVLRELGARFEAEQEVETMLLEIEAQRARAAVESLSRPCIRVFYAIWKKPWMAVNRDTYIHDVLRSAGAVNVTADHAERYPGFADDELKALAPDLVLLPDEPWEFGPRDVREIEDSGLFGTAPAILVDGKDFCWHGSRTPAGLGRAIDALAPFRDRL